MAQRLGKGLEALIPESSEKKEKVFYLNVGDIAPSPFQPRGMFDKDKLSELIASIQEKGVIQPIIVRNKGADKYELIAGERRLRATKSLNLTEIPALIMDVEDADALEISLIENIQREELNPIEEANAYRRLCDEFQFTQEKIGQTIGKDRTTVANLMRLLLLPGKIQECVQKNLISMGHARAILSIGTERAQIKFCHKIIKRGLSVRQTEAMVKKLSEKSQVETHAVKDHHIALIEEELQHRFGTRVKIMHGKKRGRIEIQYYSNEDLERILTLLRQ